MNGEEQEEAAQRAHSQGTGRGTRKAGGRPLGRMAQKTQLGIKLAFQRMGRLQQAAL